MDVEHEICANCKKEIPHFNYVMHTAHCARNITLCPVCKEPIPKNQFDDHRRKHVTNVRKIEEKVDFPRQMTGAGQRTAATSNYSNGNPLGTIPKNINGRKSDERAEIGKADDAKRFSDSKRIADSNRNQDFKRYEDSRRAEDSRRCKDSGRYQDSKRYEDSKKIEDAKRTGDAKGLPDAKKSEVNGFNLKEPASKLKTRREERRETDAPRSTREANTCYAPTKKDSLLPCKFCDLELPKLELEEHENYCGSRTDKCNVCGELVMFKYKKLHEESNHGFLKLKDEPGPRPSWDSTTQREPEPSYIRRERPPPIYTVDSFDFSPLYRSYSNDYSTERRERGEDQKEYKAISRRVDCKTEYIKNLLHDSASITVPLRRSATAPRNHFNHGKGPAPLPPQPPPPHRRPNPPTELTIPCEFCNTPIPHDSLIEHETGCRPDLARFNPRRRSPSPEDGYSYTGASSAQPASPEVELPCEFCADMFPASQLLRHQLTCT